MLTAVQDNLLRLFVESVSHPGLSRTVGRLADLELPPAVLRPLLEAYVRILDVDLSDAAEPLTSFKTFDEFFTRRLRAGARPIAGGRRTLVSPCDGKLSNFGRVTDGKLLQVKGIEYSAADLLDDPELARRFEGGTFCTLYLSPRDYHRVHAPLDGEILGYRYVPGAFYPVNSLGVNHVPGIFHRNERLTTLLRTPLGDMALVMVGATSVGRISVTYESVVTNQGSKQKEAVYYARPKSISKGAELGTFHLGSSVVLLMEPPALDLAAGITPPKAMRLGEALSAS